MKVKDLTPDSANANLGTEEGQQALDLSLAEFGFGRPILIDAEDVILAGNKTAFSAGDDADVQIIETSGEHLVVHQRLDLDEHNDPEFKARGLAYADNQVGAINRAWDKQQVLADYATYHLDPYFRDVEIAEMREAVTPPEPEHDVDTDSWVTIEIPASAELAKLWKDTLKLQTGKGYASKLKFLLDSLAL